jgi:patatin-related protein
MSPDQHSTGLPTELRLALVCYGGVSLAIYMHGITKEIHKLVAASREFDRVGVEGENPFDAGRDSRHTYFEALRAVSRRGDTPLTVTVDIISGTSAGGINGVCLAKVLACDSSQDALRQLWIDEGDLKRLLRSPGIGGWRTRAAIAAARTLLRLGKPWSPLRSERMSQLLYDAITDMNAPPRSNGSSLLPPGGTLELFVTMTDMTGLTMRVPTGAGGISQRETEHAQVLRFRAGGGVNELDDRSVGALSFAARATSCFPGAFAPVSPTSFVGELDGRSFDPDDLADRFAMSYAPTGRKPQDAWFVDGGVLNNAPFDHVIDAIAARPAESEVSRRLVYIQPDPGRRLVDTPPVDTDETSRPRDYLAGLLEAIVKVKGSHSIFRQLLDLRDMNHRIGDISTITRVQRAQVNGAIQDLWDTVRSERGLDAAPTEAWDIEDPRQVKAIADTFYAEAAPFAGAGFTAYSRLKVDATVALLAREAARLLRLPQQSSEAALLGAAIGVWARDTVTWHPLEPKSLTEVLGPADVPYRDRRLQFVLAGLNDLYRAAARPDARITRAQVDALKGEAWEMLVRLRERPRQALLEDGSETEPIEVVRTLGARVAEDVFADPADFAVKHADEIATLYATYRQRLKGLLGDDSTVLWERFASTASWDERYRRDLLSRWIGFPVWDALIFPTVGLSGLPQFSPIGVSQFSPLAATALRPVDETKLKGIALHHFAAFADAAWRENDYLWGRLDAVELILQTLRTCRPRQPAAATGAASLRTEMGPMLRQGLHQVLESEKDLARIAGLRSALAVQVDKIQELPKPG